MGQTETVGGHVIEVLGYFPATGERLMIKGVEIEVERVENRVIASILVRPRLPKQEAESG